MSAPEELLWRLAANDERCVEAVLSGHQRGAAVLNCATRALVQLSALLAVDAGTASLRWAVDAASAAGVDDGAVLQVLLTGAAARGAAQTVSSAPRLALALDVDVEVEGWDGT